jgi:hypothetical protein
MTAIPTWVYRLQVGDKIRCIKNLLDCQPGDIETVTGRDLCHGKDTILFTLRGTAWSAWLADFISFFEPLFHTNKLHSLPEDLRWVDGLKPGDKMRLIETDRDRCYGENGDEFEFVRLGEDFQKSLDKSVLDNDRNHFPSLCIINRKGNLVRPFCWRFEPVVNATPVEIEPPVELPVEIKPTLRDAVRASLLRSLPATSCG